MTFAIVALSVLMLATSCKSKKVAPEGELSGTISLSGAFALYPMAVMWADEFKQLHPYVDIDISGGGAGKGMTDALANQVDLGMVSREVYDEELKKGAYPFAVAKDAVVPTINTSNPDFQALVEHGITADDAAKLWVTEEYKTWGDMIGNGSTSPVHVYTRSDACGAAETWALWFNCKQEDLQGTAVYGDPGVASAVQSDILGIGLNNIGYVYDEETRLPYHDITVLPLDCNNNGKIDPEELFYDTKDMLVEAIADGRFPSPPARDLYLVSNGIPESELVLEFLKFILTDGQQYCAAAGYISMPEEKIEKSLKALGFDSSAEVGEELLEEEGDIEEPLSEE